MYNIISLLEGGARDLKWGISHIPFIIESKALLEMKLSTFEGCRAWYTDKCLIHSKTYHYESMKLTLAAGSGS